MPDWRFQSCVLPRMAFKFLDRINKMNKRASEKANGADSDNSAHSVRKSDSGRINKMGQMGSESGTSDSVDSVHSVRESLPNSRKTDVSGKIHPDICVPSSVIPSEVGNRAAREAARWTGRQKAERVGSERIKSLDISVSI